MDSNNKLSIFTEMLPCHDSTFPCGVVFSLLQNVHDSPGIFHVSASFI